MKMSSGLTLATCRQGLTLLELMVALTILASVLTMIYSIFMSTLQTIRLLQRETYTDRIAARILTIIRHDLQAAYIYQVKGTAFAGQDKGHCDQVNFITTRDSLLPAGNVRSDLCEVGYFLKRAAEPGVYSLYRREDFHIDNDPLHGGNALKVYDRVVRFDLRYFGKQGIKNSWDSKREKGFLPKAIEITLILRTSPRPQGHKVLHPQQRLFKTIVAPVLFSEKVKIKEPKPPEAEEQNKKKKEQDDAF